MSRSSSPEFNRLMDLLADRATVGLSSPEAAELEHLLRQYPDEAAEGFDTAAAALAVALIGEHGAEQMPEALRSRIEREAAGGAGKPLAHATVTSSPSDDEDEPLRLSFEDEPPSRTGKLPSLAWLAAAAGLGLAVWTWLSRPVPSPVPQPPTLRQVLSMPGTRSADWGVWEPKPAPEGSPVPGAANVKGRVVWNNAKQQGFMVFDGLATNNPVKSQYQLWIIDKTQKHPIDGGVFDVTSRGEVVVPIDPKIHVSDPAGFAITIEKPGGVVVSDQAQRVVVALLKD